MTLLSRGRTTEYDHSVSQRIRQLPGRTPRPTSQRPERASGGLNARARIFARLQLGGEIFLLTFPLIEPKGCRFESYLRSQTAKSRPDPLFSFSFLELSWFEWRKISNGSNRAVCNAPFFQAAFSTTLWSKRRCSTAGC
jgi:hypothetical protein